eukprot:1145374-Pelagomonas_calceolata.AAC.2
MPSSDAHTNAESIPISRQHTHTHETHQGCIHTYAVIASMSRLHETHQGCIHTCGACINVRAACTQMKYIRLHTHMRSSQTSRLHAHACKEFIDWSLAEAAPQSRLLAFRIVHKVHMLTAPRLCTFEPAHWRPTNCTPSTNQLIYKA